MEEDREERNDDFFSYYFVFVEEKRQKKVWRKNAMFVLGIYILTTLLPKVDRIGIYTVVY